MLIVIGLKAQNYQFQGNITADTTWQADTLEITGNVIIDSNVILTIVPGTFIHIKGYYSISSYGSIRAIGTETDSITFTHLNTMHHSDTSTILGGWHGIRLLPRSTNDTSIFIYCHISYGKSVIPGSWWSTDYPENNGGNIYCYNFGSLIIEHCFIGNGIVKHDGGGVYCKYGSYVSIKNSHISANHGFYSGGGIFVWGADSLFIENNLVNYNISFNYLYNTAGGMGGGIWVLGYTGYSLICYNKIFNNEGVNGGVYHAYFNSNLNNNLICNNEGVGIFAGGGSQSNATDTYTNNTIANNNGWMPSGVTVRSNFATFTNNIIWNNLSHYPGDIQIYIKSVVNPKVTYCNVMDGYEGTGNINSIPLFANPTLGVGLGYNALNADWTLLDDSQSINAGTPDTTGLNLPYYDIAENPRVFGNRIDMGAYENQHVYVKIDNAPISEEIKLYPNPGTNSLYIQIVPEMKGCFFDLYNGQGNIIMHYQIEDVNSVFAIENIPSGVYHYQIYNNNKVLKNSTWIKL